MLRLATRQAWQRRGRSLLLLVALALGTGLVTATGGIGALLRTAAARPLFGRPADLWISSAYDEDYDLPAVLAEQVRATPGVDEVLPVLRRPGQVWTAAPGAGPPRYDSLSLLSADLDQFFQLHDLTLAAGRLPSDGAPGLVALAPWALVRELTLGQPITLSVPSGDVSLPLVGLLEVENLADAQTGLVLYLPRGPMARFYGLEGVATVLELRLEPGTSPRRVRAALEGALGPAYAVSAASHPDPQLWQRLILGALLFVDGLTLVGSVMLVYGVFASGAHARRRQVGLLRAAGATRRQVLALVLLEAALVGLAGSGLGLLLGTLFARLGGRWVLEGGSGPPVSVSPGVLAGAAGLCLFTALAGALLPALGAARLPPVEALLFTPRPLALGSAGARAATLLAGRLPVWLPLSLVGLARNPLRSLLTALALALILAMFLGNAGVLSLLGEELEAGLGGLAGGDYLVLPGLTTLSFRELAGQDTSDVPPLSPGMLAALEELEEQVWLMGGTTANVEALQAYPGQPTLLLDVEGYARMGSFHFVAGNWSSALADFRRGPAVLLTTSVARRLDADLGQVIHLPTPGGAVAFRVAGIGDSEFTTCILDLADGSRYLGASEVNAVMVQVRPAADELAVRQLLRQAVRRNGATLLPLEQVSAGLGDMLRQARLSIGLLIAAAGVVAVLGVVNTSLSTIAERRHEIGLLRAVGATRPQLARLVVAEAALLGSAAGLLGAALGWLATVAFVVVARSSLGVSAVPSWLPFLVTTLAGLLLWPLLAAAASLATALYAARLPVVEGLHEAR